MVGRCTASVIASASRKSFFCPFRIGANVLRRHQPGIVAQRLKLATEMMRADASFHADQARRHIGKAGLHLATRPPLPQHDDTALILAYDVERVLADIDANRGDFGVECLGHGVLLVFGAPCQFRSQAGQEHGWTIPLAEGAGRYSRARSCK
jgi:hypothetical protein